MMARKSIVLILTYLFASATTQHIENAIDGVVDDGFVDKEPMKDHDVETDRLIRPNSDESIEAETVPIEDGFSSIRPTAEKPSEFDPEPNFPEVEENLPTSLPFRSTVAVNEEASIDQDEPGLVKDDSSNRFEELGKGDSADTVLPDEDPIIVDDVEDSTDASSCEENHVSGAKSKDNEIQELKTKIRSLEEKNDQLEDNLEYYVKHESFVYKLIGGQMIEFVCVSIGLLLIFKISDILLMVTDILEKVVIPIVRCGPVYSMQTKDEVSIIF